ncbi:hypothetical protein GUJ93_ZPchr0011g28084 [Zizania palustris]|uniref:Uncharacterized protein n=1 Tax=Zizania palustris TaxID=103762 RepID=A0A8J5WGC0_ZIZPA|nr:hypothetical protein GUJ93_ZPchr0011g28084 [Zizania palustris]
MAGPMQRYEAGRHVAPRGRVEAQWVGTWHRWVGQWHNGAMRGGTTTGHHWAGWKNCGAARGDTTGQPEAGRRRVAPRQCDARQSGTRCDEEAQHGTTGQDKGMMPWHSRQSIALCRGGAEAWIDNGGPNEAL